MSEREREEVEEVSASIMAGSRALGQHNVCETRSLSSGASSSPRRGREKESTSDAMRAGRVKMKRRGSERVEVRIATPVS